MQEINEMNGETGSIVFVRMFRLRSDELLVSLVLEVRSKVVELI